ncbi:MAG: DUF4331 domain-containing protein [Actinobacteria bacterium]|nr:DUF4331 domain-containing protein [Actinomycetota bacterium]MCA1719672.1 DUF4331 domain-containing protein [Actinomycetota bacterium]
MSQPQRPARTRAVAVLAAAATVAGGAALLGPGTSSASSHREAPYTASDPLIDNTDTYAFVSPDDDTTATLITNVVPLQDPSGGPTFFPFATDARYNINVDNNGDAKPDLTFRWTFKDVDKRVTVQHGNKGGGSFSYTDGVVDSLTDDNLLFRQTYTVQAIDNATGVTTALVTDAPVPPNNIGIGSIPNYLPLRDAAVEAGKVAGGPFDKAQVFAGQRRDPFFLDLRVFDLLYGGPNHPLEFTGFNHVADKNVNTLAIKVPKNLLAAGGSVADNPVIGVWASTDRHSTRTLQATNTAPMTSESRSSDEVSSDPNADDFVQVSRLGMPLVNEVVVPAPFKDYFNRSTPDNDAKLQPVVDRVIDPEVPYLVEKLYGIPNPNKASGTKKDRDDLFAVFLTGVDGLNSIKLNKQNAGVPSEQLRLNLSIPPSANPNRLGVLGGDNAGFPNGRRLRDDIVDITLQVAEGVLVPEQDAATKDAVKGLGDGVNSAAAGLGSGQIGDQQLGSFPYVADPIPGTDVPIGATPVSFTQVVTSANGTVTTQIKNITPAIPGGIVQLYRVNGDGSLTGFGTSQLNAAGTESIVRTFRATPGTKITLNFRVFPKRGSAAQVNRGLPTTITVR